VILQEDSATNRSLLNFHLFYVIAFQLSNGSEWKMYELVQDMENGMQLGLLNSFLKGKK